jgi:hypothetical protein
MRRTREHYLQCVSLSNAARLTTDARACAQRLQAWLNGEVAFLP